VPAQTPKEIVGRLHAEFVRVLAMPDVKERFLADGTDPVGDTPEHFGIYVRDELTKWAKVAKAAGIKPE
jgi:tripartite-type tricarboxylate transporter receptor subunit TctC